MTRPHLLRPVLLPGLTRLWRDPHTLQIGLDPASAVLLELPDPRAATLLDLLDGGHPERTVITRGVRLGVPAEHVRALLDTLHAAGLVVGGHAFLPPGLPAAVARRVEPEATALALRGRTGAATPAQVLRRRGAARAVVTVGGRLAAPVAVALGQAGVGHVWPDLGGRVTAAEVAGGPLTAAEVHRPRAEAVADAVRRGAPGTRTDPVRRGTASIVVQLGTDRPVSVLAAGYARRRQPHLSLTVRDGAAVVGPLVPAAGGPCLNCLDLHRRDRDPGWPEVSGQLATAHGDTAEPCAVATLLAAAGYAAAEVLAYLDGGSPETVGAAVEITAPGHFRRRQWPPHPRCGCARRSRAGGAPPGRTRRSTGSQPA